MCGSDRGGCWEIESFFSPLHHYFKMEVNCHKENTDFYPVSCQQILAVIALILPAAGTLC